jgi:hypothetical protein
MPPDTPAVTPADLAAAEAILGDPECWPHEAVGYTELREAIGAALARRADEARREGREAGRREAAEHCIGTLRAAADKARHLSRANDGSREGDACAWTADTLAELADRLAALPPPGEGGK